MKPADRCNTIVLYIQLSNFYLAVLIALALLLNLIPEMNHLAYATSRIFHVGLLYMSMYWVRELTRLRSHTTTTPTLQVMVDSSKRICYLLITIAIQCVIVDLVYLGGVIIYYGCIATQIIIGKGIVFLVMVAVIHGAQILTDIIMTVNLWRSLPVIKACLAD